MDASYGFRFDQVNTVVRPMEVRTAWGEWVACAVRPEYALGRLRFNRGGVQQMRFYLRRSGAYYVEDGTVLLCERLSSGHDSAVSLSRGEVAHVTAGTVHSIGGLEPSVVYCFSDGTADDARYVETEAEALHRFDASRLAAVQRSDPEGTVDRRTKYWGTIETIISRDFAGKRIALAAGGQSSLEFHIGKRETYFIHSGAVKVGLRIGRGENRSVLLREGDCFDVQPGLVHMRIGLEKSVIIEVSTQDTDADSFIVEDGRTYRHVEVV